MSHEVLARVLVVEDEPGHQRALTAGLGVRGFEVEVVDHGGEALRRAEALRPDVAVVDLGLPDIDGLEVCRHLLLREVCPVLVVTADDDAGRMVAALDLDVGDYVTKPYDLEVLAARIRRTLRAADGVDAGRPHDVISIGDLAINVDAHEVRIGGAEVHLQPVQFSALVLLARSSPTVLSYRSLARALHGTGEPPANSRDRVRTTVSSIRRALGDGPRRPRLETEFGVGYRLVPPPPAPSAGPGARGANRRGATASFRRRGG